MRGPRQVTLFLFLLNILSFALILAWCNGICEVEEKALRVKRVQRSLITRALTLDGLGGL